MGRAVAFNFGLVVKATPEYLGTAIWNPKFSVSVVPAEAARTKGQEIFAKFDNAVHN